MKSGCPGTIAWNVALLIVTNKDAPGNALAMVLTITVAAVYWFAGIASLATRRIRD